MTITFTFTVASSHIVTIQWYKDGVPLVDGTYDGVVIAGVDTNTLTITDPTAAWNGSYYATIIDDTAVCTVTTDPVEVGVPGTCTLIITLQPDSEELEVGNTLELEVAISGAQGAPTYQWYLDGVALVDGASGDATISGATTSSLTITDITEALAGDYTVVVIDPFIAECSITSDAATVAVSPAPPLAPPTGMFLWYQADVQPYGDGVFAFPLLDSSGNNYNMDESGNPAPYENPYVETNELNGLPVLRYNPTGSSSNDINSLEIGGLGMFPPIDFTGVTIVLVIKRDSIPVSPTFADIPISTVYGTGLSGYHFLKSNIDGSGVTFSFYVNFTLLLTSTPISMNTWQIVTATFDGIEGIARIKTNDVTDTAPGATPLSIQQSLGSSLQMAVPGAIAEVFFYARKLSSIDETQLRAYLSDKWGIAITV